MSLEDLNKLVEEQKTRMKQSVIRQVRILLNDKEMKVVKEKAVKHIQAQMIIENAREREVFRSDEIDVVFFITKEDDTKYNAIPEETESEGKSWCKVYFPLKTDERFQNFFQEMAIFVDDKMLPKNRKNFLNKSIIATGSLTTKYRPVPCDKGTKFQYLGSFLKGQGANKLEDLNTSSYEESYAFDLWQYLEVL